MFACNHSIALSASNLINYQSAAYELAVEQQLYIFSSKDGHLQRVHSNVGINSDRPHLLSATN